MGDEKTYCEPECVICAYFNGDLDDIQVDPDAEPLTDEWLDSMNQVVPEATALTEESQEESE